MKVPLFRIYWDSSDIKEVAKVIKSGSYWCVGKQIEELEKKIAEYLGVKYCVLFNSGGSALHAVLLAHKINGGEVIVPSFTFIATAFAPLYVNARPVFADIEESTLGLDPDDVSKKITKKTKVILPIHYGGIPCKINELREIAQSNNVILIEDAAEAFGAKLGKKFVGTFGDSAIFSFCQNKIFTTSEGGCVVTNSKRVYRRLKLIVSYGRVVKGDYFYSGDKVDYKIVGYNWRMSTILAALGISQLEKVDKLIKKRRNIAERYNSAFKKIKMIKVLEEPRNAFAVYQLYTIRVPRKLRNPLIKFLKEKGIGSKVYFEPVHRYSVFKKIGFSKIKLPVTEKVSREVISLPIYPSMKKEETTYVIDAVREFFEKIEG